MKSKPILKKFVLYYHAIFLVMSLTYFLVFLDTRHYADVSLPRTSLLWSAVSAGSVVFTFLALHFRNQAYARVFNGMAWMGPMLLLFYWATAKLNAHIQWSVLDGLLGVTLLGMLLAVLLAVLILNPSVWFVTGVLTGYSFTIYFRFFSTYHQLSQQVPSIAGQLALIQTFGSTGIQNNLPPLFIPLLSGLTALAVHAGIRIALRRMDSPSDRV